MTNPGHVGVPRGTVHAIFGYGTVVADPIGIDVAESLPNGESQMFSPLTSTLIYGQNDAVLVYPPLTTDQAKALGDWIEASGKRLTTSSPPMVTAIIGSLKACWPSGSARD